MIMGITLGLITLNEFNGIIAGAKKKDVLLCPRHGSSFQVVGTEIDHNDGEDSVFVFMVNGPNEILYFKGIISPRSLCSSYKDKLHTDFIIRMLEAIVHAR